MKINNNQKHKQATYDCSAVAEPSVDAAFCVCAVFLHAEPILARSTDCAVCSGYVAIVAIVFDTTPRRKNTQNCHARDRPCLDIIDFGSSFFNYKVADHRQGRRMSPKRFLTALSNTFTRTNLIVAEVVDDWV